MGATATADVNVMLGDPKKAIKLLTIPIAVALLLQQGNSIIDTLWVTSLGSVSMAALGLVNPIYSVILGLGNGMAIGASSAIARNIGMKRKESADGIATQAILLVVLMALVLTPILLITAEPVLMMIGATDTLDASMQYALPLYLSSFILMLSAMMSGLLRGEGAAKRSMYIQVLCAVSNIILDPIFIYVLDMGVAGAAWATVISCILSIIVGMYWYLSKKTYIDLKLGHLRYNLRYMREILIVGIPQSAELCLMSLFNIVYNLCIIAISTEGIMAIYTSVWRLMYLALIPSEAIGGAIESVCSAEYGMKRGDMIKQAFHYSSKLSILSAILLTVVVMVLADPISSIFTHAPDMQSMHDDMVYLVRVLFLCLPLLGMVFVGSSVLQAIGRAIVSMWSSFFRNVLLSVVFIALTFTIGTLSSLWWGMAIVEVFGGMMMWYLAIVAIRGMEFRDRPVSI